jgi:hypothetical protein
MQKANHKQKSLDAGRAAKHRLASIGSLELPAGGGLMG